jgi:hypothetical protein
VCKIKWISFTVSDKVDNLLKVAHTGGCVDLALEFGLLVST